MLSSERQCSVNSAFRENEMKSDANSCFECSLEHRSSVFKKYH